MKNKIAQNEKWPKGTLWFCMYKIWQIPNCLIWLCLQATSDFSRVVVRKIELYNTEYKVAMKPIVSNTYTLDT